jgi:hypothetical protein
MKAVVDIIGGVVERTAQRIKNITPLYYSYGHIREVIDVLASYSKTEEFSKQKYPRIILLQDFVEKRGTSPDLDAELSLQLLIVAGSNATYRAVDRMSNVFKPVLYPIYEAFIKELSSIGIFWREGFPHEKIDRLMLSNALGAAMAAGDTKSLLNDHLDGIEIRNLNLKLIKQYC